MVLRGVEDLCFDFLKIHAGSEIGFFRRDSWGAKKQISGRGRRVMVAFVAPENGADSNALFRLLEAQKVLFADTPSRISLKLLTFVENAGAPKQRINVWRNHAIEPLLASAEPYFAYASALAEFHISNYDDSLSFDGWQQRDFELLWVDPGHYLSRNSARAWLDWLAHRVSALRDMSSSPIVIATWLPSDDYEDLGGTFSSLRGVYVADISALAGDKNEPLLDESSHDLAGTPLNPKLHSVIARELACHWIPGAIAPPQKAVFVDLDNTLYDGILAEDGPPGLKLSLAHSHLQQNLVELKNRGVFLGLVSKNQFEDVRDLFQERTDFPLRLEDFSVVEVSWEDKHIAIQRGLRELGIARDSAIFIDDNPGEILAVAAALPGVRLIHASKDAYLTERALRYSPGLWRWSVESEDLKRIEDQKANRERVKMLEATQDPRDYFAGLRVRLTFELNPIDKLSRASDLSLRTNQFNLSMLRLNQSEIARYIEQNGAVVAVSLEDRLSDSGMIGLVLIRFEGPCAFVDEVTMSCRALGRRLENSVILGAIRLALEGSEIDRICFAPTEGPRNQPALEWLGNLGPSFSGDQATIPIQKVRDFQFAEGIEWAIRGGK